jgi:hypothetical protein
VFLLLLLLRKTCTIDANSLVEFICFLHDDEKADEAPLCNGCIEHDTAAKLKNDSGSIVW